MPSGPIGGRNGQSALATISWGPASVLVEIRLGRQSLVAGPWSLAVRVDGRPAPIFSGWEETCRVSDRDADYVELEATLANGWRVQRHLLLARRDRFLWLGDALLSPASLRPAAKPPQLVYRSQLPVCPGIPVRPAAESWEYALGVRGGAVRVLPLALSEWRCDRRTGQLVATPQGLELRQQSLGQNLFATLFVDLQAKRSRRTITWRRLTVGEDRQRVPDDLAVAYRVQIGAEQWVFYRALGGKGRRSFLGTHTADETLAGRFAKGVCEPLLRIEALEEDAR